jgi:hypothetical protein
MPTRIGCVISLSQTTSSPIQAIRASARRAQAVPCPWPARVEKTGPKRHRGEHLEDRVVLGMRHTVGRGQHYRQRIPGLTPSRIRHEDCLSTGQGNDRRDGVQTAMEQKATVFPKESEGETP